MIIVYTNEINLVFPPPSVLFSLVCIPRDTKKPVFDPVFILVSLMLPSRDMFPSRDIFLHFLSRDMFPSREKSLDVSVEVFFLISLDATKNSDPDISLMFSSRDISRLFPSRYFILLSLRI